MFAWSGIESEILALMLSCLLQMLQTWESGHETYRRAYNDMNGNELVVHLCYQRLVPGD